LLGEGRATASPLPYVRGEDAGTKGNMVMPAKAGIQ
jgi:hypothetical protein